MRSSRRRSSGGTARCSARPEAARLGQADERGRRRRPARSATRGRPAASRWGPDLRASAPRGTRRRRDRRPSPSSTGRRPGELLGISSATITAMRKLEREPERTADRLRRGEHGEARGERAERADHRRGEGAELDHPAPADTVGEQGDRQREDDAEAHTAPATPWPQLPMPKSSAAKFTVWVNSVLTNAAVSEAAARRPRTRTSRSSRRSGGAHHGCRPGGSSRASANAGAATTGRRA